MANRYPLHITGELSHINVRTRLSVSRSPGVEQHLADRYEQVPDQALLYNHVRGRVGLNLPVRL